MKLGVRGLPGSELAFGKKRLGVLSETELVVRDTSGFREVVRLPLDGGRALAVLADGSLVAADRSRVVRLMPHDQKARTYPRISLLPGSNLFSDRVSPDRLWVLPGSGQTLFGYAVQGGAETLLKIDALVELEEFDRKTVGSLRDGSFLYTTASGFRQFHGTGKKLPLAGETSGIFRILPGSRPDTTWLLAESGRATLCRVLAGKLVRLHELALEAPPYDAVADGRLLAVLELLQPSDAPWSWVLEVFDESGTRRRRFELPAVETFDDEWVKSLTRNRSLALSADPAVVAVGGPTELGLWDLHKGERIPTDP